MLRGLSQLPSCAVNLEKKAKGKAPGFSGNGPDLYAALPGCWVEWAVELANIMQFTQIAPRAWQIDLVHYRPPHPHTNRAKVKPRP